MTREPEADPADIPAATSTCRSCGDRGTAAITDLDDRVAAALRHALAPNTWRAYAADWRHWSAWARCYDTPAMPAEPAALARYLVDQATTTRVTTLTRRLSAIAKAHLLAGHDDPTGAPAIRGVLRGLRRERGTTQRGAPPLWTSDVERILDATHSVPNRTWGPGRGTAEVRDRALLLLAFTSALRRSELAALDVADLESDPAGLVVHVVRGKTDQNAEGALVGIPHASRPRLCAVAAIDAWRIRLATLLDVDPAALTARCSDRSTAVAGSARSARAGTARTPGCPPTRSATSWSGGPAPPASPPHTASGSSPPTPPAPASPPKPPRTGPASARSWTRADGDPCRSPAATSAAAACSPTTPLAGSDSDVYADIRDVASGAGRSPPGV